MNFGEELVSEYLQHIKGCSFIQRQVANPDIQGETDIIGIDPHSKELYLCEVAIHLATGLQYTKNGKPNNVGALEEKFSRDVKYVRKYFPGYKIHVMLWSPIVRQPRASAKHNQMSDVLKIQRRIKKKFGLELEAIINKKFLDAVEELRNFTADVTKELKSPVSRLLQVEAHLRKHLTRKP